MFETKYPFEYKLISQSTPINPDESRCTIRLRNISDHTLINLELWLPLFSKQGSQNIQHCLFRNLIPNGPKTMSSPIHASRPNTTYLRVYGEGGVETRNFSRDAENEISSKKNNKAKEKIKAKIIKLKAQYVRKSDAFDRWCEKTEKEVWDWMT